MSTPGFNPATFEPREAVYDVEGLNLTLLECIQRQAERRMERRAKEAERTRTELAEEVKRAGETRDGQWL